MALVLFDKPEDGVGVLTLHRPEKLNALSTALLHELTATLDPAEADPEVRVLILTVAGEKAFAAGADIAEYQGRREKAFMDFQFGGREVNDRLEAFPKPTIAAVNGYALGLVRPRDCLVFPRAVDERSASSARWAACRGRASAHGGSRASALFDSGLRRCCASRTL